MILIQAEIKRYFDKTNGNSYFTARATKHGPEANTEPETCIAQYDYGYGSHPEFELCKVMKDAGWLPKGEHKGLRLAVEDDNGFRLILTDYGYGKKRDCKF